MGPCGRRPQTYFDLRVGLLVLLTGCARKPTVGGAFTHVTETESSLQRRTQCQKHEKQALNESDKVTQNFLVLMCARWKHRNC